MCSQEDDCNKVHCEVCGFHFCFCCGDAWREGHHIPHAERDKVAEVGESPNDGQSGEADMGDNNCEVTAVEE
ncbi:hypothetical protein BDV97DRAFT_355578 [Delphinella strobiligena]|nr:hypothetical protein BDV97DRAFT_355578 [Delphinella strobiligena]